MLSNYDTPSYQTGRFYIYSDTIKSGTFLERFNLNNLPGRYRAWKIGQKIQYSDQHEGREVILLKHGCEGRYNQRSFYAGVRKTLGEIYKTPDFYEVRYTERIVTSTGTVTYIDKTDIGYAWC